MGKPRGPSLDRSGVCLGWRASRLSYSSDDSASPPSRHRMRTLWAKNLEWYISHFRYPEILNIAEIDGIQYR